MSEDWQTNIRKATDELKTIAADAAAKNAKLKQNITTAKSILDDVIAPALADLKKELEENGTSTDTDSGETGVSRPNRGFYGSITVNLDAVLSDSGTDSSEEAPFDESTFFYAFSVEAEPHDLAYENEFYIIDRGNKIEIIAEDYEELPDDSAEAPSPGDIKEDFARKYLYAVQEVKKQRIVTPS
ncbi:MAG: hypothetical protein ACXV5T_06240 [Halobacteriota archaeon]